MSTKRKPKLKPQPANGYPVTLCAAEGCGRESDIIDSTRNIWDFDVPLCDDDYAKRPPAPMREPEPKSVKEDDEAERYTQVKTSTVEANAKSHRLFG